MNATNPYTSPQSTVADAAGEQYGEVRVFSTSGRLGRLRYLGYGMAVNLVVWFAVMLLGLVASLIPSQATNIVVGIIGVGLYIAVIVVAFMLMIQRIHDFDTSGWLALLMLVPLVNVVFGLLLLFLPGTKGSNRFGAEPPPNSTGVIVLAALVPIAVFVIGILAAIAIPAYNQYIQRAKAQQQGQVQTQPYQSAPSTQR
ncbi:MAG: DUF805 domain-containing protein [Gammaproteobacteria bacterium]